MREVPAIAASGSEFFRRAMSAVRPEYLFRPMQVIRRLHAGLSPSRGAVKVRLPWGHEIVADAGEQHGRALLHLGVGDLRVCEMIFRVVQPGDTAVDVGANIGIMTSAMATRAGREGSVIAFEPHPELRHDLESNAHLWCARNVTILPFALSDRTKSAKLVETDDFEWNAGTSHLSTNHAEVGFEVDCRAFDEIFSSSTKIRLTKIDVEGHEDTVLSGMLNSLSTKKIDVLIFEEHRDLPSPATELLESYGYALYQIDRTLVAPKLIPIGLRPPCLRFEATNIIALANPAELRRLESTGWRCLGI
jgi:FkbM family methyltransferase